MESTTEIVRVDTGHHVHVERHASPLHRETVILVNGALATTESFRQTVKYLRPHFNVVLYDLPYYGHSRPHNPAGGLLANADEVRILRTLIDRYQAHHIASISWGGVAALLALAQRPPSVRTAVIGSFSPLINPAMQAYIATAQAHLENGDHGDAASLLNETVGQYLPRLLKLYNHRYISGLSDAQYRQMIFHIRQMRALPVHDYLRTIESIDIPVLFLNGELDRYTTAADIRSLAAHIRQSHFETIPEAGHFLELENKRTWERVRHIVTRFMIDPGHRQPLGAPPARPEPVGQWAAA